MALIDRPRLAQIAETIEDRVGLGLITRGERSRFAVMEREFMELASDAEDLALHSLDYFHGRPSEMSHERRKRIAQRSRVALKFDPLAGAEAQILGDFTFGKGVPKPTARDEDVQQVIDEAWSDANNEEKLTGFQAQRKLSNELLTAGELFITGYEGGGHFRVGRLDPDTVEAVVPDPEDRLRPLWYVARQRRFRWDFDNDQAKFDDELTRQGKPRMMYWKHWRNYDDAVQEREQGLVDPGEDELITPPDEKIAKGVVFHVAINQTGEELRGNPPWARQLRFFTAMNVLTEAHVTMAQGASTFVAKRVNKGTPKQVARAASSVLGHVSELGASQGLGSEEVSAFAPGGQAPPAPGSWWTENEESRLESMSLNSGAAQMAQTAQIVRAPIAAAAQFGQHYFGDAGNANLATASTLELPANMRIEGWGSLFEGVARWFTDRSIEAAVKSGRFGGMDGLPDEAGPMSELRLHEAEDRAAMEKRTKRDLSYEFVMPFPGRRQLPEVSAYVQVIGQSMDPNGVNVPLRRHLLRFAFEQMGIDDVGRAVEECLPDEGMPGGIGPQEDDVIDPATGEPQIGPDGLPMKRKREPDTQDGPPGDRAKRAKQGTTIDGKPTSPVSESEWVPAELREAMEEFGEETGARFRTLFGDEAIAAAMELTEPPAGNGNGAGH